MPFGVGGPAESAVEAPGIIGRITQGLMGMPKHLIDAAAQFDPNDIHGSTERVIPAAADTAIGLAGLGMPAAEAGAAGIFGGRLAMGADLKALAEAEKMAAGGKLPAPIRSDTGWSRSPADGLWRFEIPDNKAALKYMPTGEGDKAIGSIDSLVSHPELFKNYPIMRNWNAQITRDSSVPTGSGGFTRSNLLHEAAAPNMQVGRSVMLHELQHGVQHLEKFSPGSDPSHFAREIERGVMKDPELLKKYDFNEMKAQADNLYHKTAGEVESRNVQHRMDFSPQMRADQHPWVTQDVPFADQYRFDNVLGTLEALKNK
jgi:hypothetical protein